MIVQNQRHTTDIVAAYVRHNSIATDQISGLINAVHSTLNGLGNDVVEEPPRVPAVSVRRSVRPDHIICIECGYNGQMLKKHLQSRHGKTGPTNAGRKSNARTTSFRTRAKTASNRSKSQKFPARAARKGASARRVASA